MEKISVINTEVVPLDLNIQTAMGRITRGYALRVRLQNMEAKLEVIVDACNLCVWNEQTPQWCIDQCNRLAEELLEKQPCTPGEILLLLHCGYEPLAKLGVLTPPQKHQATMAEMKAFYARTGRGMVYIENDLYREWAVAYNEWIRFHPEKAADFNLTIQDESWMLVK